MKVAIMQPYFFPYLGYYTLIKNADKWIIFDTPQFIRHGWIERNRILKPDAGWQYIAVPLIKSPQKTPINETIIRNDEPWQKKILAQLTHYKKKAPHYFKVIKLVEECLAINTNSLVALNDHILKCTCGYLNVDYNSHIFSKMNIEIDPVNEPDEWALQITKSIHGTAYLNPPGGMTFFNKQKYIDAGIDLRFLNIKLTDYDQSRPVFEAGLSIIDVMMFNSPTEINSMLNQYEILE